MAEICNIPVYVVLRGWKQTDPTVCLSLNRRHSYIALAAEWPILNRQNSGGNLEVHG